MRRGAVPGGSLEGRAGRGAPSRGARGDPSPGLSPGGGQALLPPALASGIPRREPALRSPPPGSDPRVPLGLQALRPRVAERGRCGGGTAAAAPRRQVLRRCGGRLCKVASPPVTLRCRCTREVLVRAGARTGDGCGGAGARPGSPAVPQLLRSW